MTRVFRLVWQALDQLTHLLSPLELLFSALQDKAIFEKSEKARNESRGLNALILHRVHTPLF